MQAKAYKGMGMEGGIARWYAKLTHKDMDEFKALARRMAEGLPPGASVLEVAPGPGYFSIELAKLGKYHVTGVDISKTFVGIAQKNAKAEGVEVEFRQGDAAHLPFADENFDLIVCRAAFKNFSEPVKALREMRRVSRPGGKAVIIDLRRDTPRAEIDKYANSIKESAWNRFIVKWTFRLMLLKRAYTLEEFKKMIAASGFATYGIKEQPMGCEITLTR
jgi:ubiquinone/menaquinone biosynthesis C-methylase UbiE